mgnify:CR=1 FL=1
MRWRWEAPTANKYRARMQNESQMNERGEAMSKRRKKDVVARARQAASKPGVRIRAVRRSKPDVQRLAQALIEIAMSQAEVVVDEPDDVNESRKAAS